MLYSVREAEQLTPPSPTSLYSPWMSAVIGYRRTAEGVKGWKPRQHHSPPALPSLLTPGAQPAPAPCSPPARQCSLLGKDTPENYCDALPRQMGGRENYSTVGSGDIFVLMRQ